jgi:demethoxyubiquinone hydroxylase (CLK1/Coq7/Cat5 family)
MSGAPFDKDAMLRVDQAGEYGATRIYAGQLAVLGNRGPRAAEIAAMAAQEEAHRARFDALLARRGVRPGNCDGLHRRDRGGNRSPLYPAA